MQYLRNLRGHKKNESLKREHGQLSIRCTPNSQQCQKSDSETYILINNVIQKVHVNLFVAEGKVRLLLLNIQS